MPLLIALQFLTRLPVTLWRLPEPHEQGRSLLWYPLVGLLLGGLLWLAGWLLQGQVEPLLLAALLLALWVWLSGGLHLDGLADTADAWVGGYGDRERTLRIMKDPACGPVGVITLVLLLLLKWAALHALLQQQMLSALLLAPWLGRCSLPLLFALTPYVRPAGLGSALAEHLPRAELPWVLGLHVLLMLLFGWPVLLLLGSLLLAFWYVRRQLLARLGGTTGDSAGALLEIIELLVLLGMLLLF